MTHSRRERPPPSLPPFSIHPLTWTFCEVVEAAVPGPRAALVAVARPVRAVHPPAGGQTAQVSAPAASAGTAPGHRVVPAQGGERHQQTRERHRGSHPEEEEEEGVRSGQTLEPGRVPLQPREPL